MAKLIVRGPGGSEEIRELSADLIRIGRDRECDIILPQSKVSRQHALVEREEDGFLLHDLGSVNGTFVNGEMLKNPRPLSSGDRIDIGDFRLVFVIETVAEDSSVGHVSAGIKRVVRPPPGAPPDVRRAEMLLEVRRAIHRRLQEYMDLRKMSSNRLQDRQLRIDTRRVVEELVIELSGDIPAWVDRKELTKDVLEEALGLGPLEDLLADPAITEVMVNSKDDIYIEREGKIQKVPKRFTSNDAVLSVIERIVHPLGLRIDQGSPYVDARLEDGSQVNAIIPPLALRGPCITIRKFSKTPYTQDDLLAFNSFPREFLRFLEAAVRGRKNLIISGSTAAGKTTLLNVMAGCLPPEERIITVEEAAELRLPQEHVVNLETRPPDSEGRKGVTLRDLVRNALRMRPDRIVVGECRGGEALELLQAMSTGHEGSMTTVHADSPQDTVHRLETMVLTAGVEMPVMAIRDRIASGIDLIVQTARFSDGSRKITHISEVLGIDHQGRVAMVDLFRFVRTGLGKSGSVLGFFTATGTRPTFLEELGARGIPISDHLFTPNPRYESPRE